MEINNFIIEKFNQYSLDEKAKLSICPLCSSSRKKNTEKCATLHWDTGLGVCHHCGESFQLHTYKKKTDVKEYKRPIKWNYTSLSDNLVKWFSNRGISQFTLKALKVGESKEWMPQVQREQNTINFNYFENGEIVNIKYRDGAKNFKLFKDAKLIFYNLDSISISEEVVIVEGECFDDKAEILTSNGWKLFSELNGEDLVAQYNEDNSIEFIIPKSKIIKQFSGELIEYHNKKNNLYSLTTPRHNLVVERNGKILKVRADEITHQINVIRSGVFDGVGLKISDNLLRLYIAISADFTLRKTGDIYGRFKKERKFERIIWLLESLGIRYSSNIDSRSYHSIFIHKGHGLNAFKLFPFEWIGVLSKHQIDLILDEIILWDGNSVCGRTMKEYNSKEIHNIKFIQTLCHLSNKQSTICKRKNKYGEWYKATILQKNRSSISKNKSSKVDYDGLVYCVTVNSGMILVKQNNNITISGNCDCLSFVEAGINTVVSTPNGSTLKTVNLEYLDNCIEYFDNKKKIYLALDNDAPGQNVTKELIRRLGAERCFLVDFGDCKDANEYLVKHGKESLKNTVINAKEIPIEGVSSVMNWETEYDKFLLNGMKKGYVIGKKHFDSIFSTYTGQFIVVTGIPSSGKSDWVDEMCISYNLQYGWKTAYASPENKPNVIHAAKLESKICGQWVNKHEQVNSVWHKKAKQFIDDNFKFIDLDSFDLDEVLSRAKRLIRKFGIKCLVIDPYNKVRLKASLNKNITDYTNDYLIKIDEFARNNDILIFLVAHPVKPSGEERKTYKPNFYSIKGGGEFYDMSPHGLLVHRDYENDMVLIEVMKVKFSWLGENNSGTWFQWNRSNGRYSEFDYQSEIAAQCSNPIIDNDNWIVEEENKIEQNKFDFYDPDGYLNPSSRIDPEDNPF